MNLHWHIIIPKSPYFALGFTFGVVYSMGLEKCMMTCSPHDSITYNSFTNQKALCALPVYPFLPARPWQLVIFKCNVSIVWPFPKCCSIGIIQYIAFSDWLLSVNNTFLSTPYLFMVWYLISFYHWIILHFLDVPQFIYPLTYWRTTWLLPSFDNYE